MNIINKIDFLLGEAISWTKDSPQIALEKMKIALREKHPGRSLESLIKSHLANARSNRVKKEKLEWMLKAINDTNYKPVEYKPEPKKQQNDDDLTPIQRLNKELSKGGTIGTKIRERSDGTTVFFGKLPRVEQNDELFIKRAKDEWLIDISRLGYKIDDIYINRRGKYPSAEIKISKK